MSRVSQREQTNQAALAAYESGPRNVWLVTGLPLFPGEVKKHPVKPRPAPQPEPAPQVEAAPNPLAGLKGRELLIAVIEEKNRKSAETAAGL